MKLLRFFFLFCFVTLNVWSQDQTPFYATMFLGDAKALQKELPSEVTILETFGYEAVVQMTPHASHKLHDRILVHGPGYVFKSSYEAALESLRKTVVPNRATLAYTITENQLVNEVLDVVNGQNIEDQILELEAYGSRHHTLPTGTQAAMDLKTKWEAMITAYGRTDASVRLYNHSSTSMPSVIMTIEGAEFPDEYVVTGGHLDSTSFITGNAPGADDDASGIATITEAVRSLFEIGFVPQRTIEIMAYAAEEVGLVGSNEIAQDYSNSSVNVVSYVQFDMTNYQGSANDVYFITDHTDNTLTTYLTELLNFYNSSGSHVITYGMSQCNYGCSDHASWDDEGYPAAFPFEASFGQHNGEIHTPNDEYSLVGTTEHAVKFSKLCATYLIEVSKGYQPLGVSSKEVPQVSVYTKNNLLYYQIGMGTNFEAFQLFDLQGRTVIQLEGNFQGAGQIELSNLPSGVYMVAFSSEKTAAVTKKVTLR